MLAMAMKTLKMINMIILEKKQDPNWSTGKHQVICEKIKACFALDDEVADMNVEEDLRKIKLSKIRNPKKLLDNIAAIKIQYGYVLPGTKKASMVL